MSAAHRELDVAQGVFLRRGGERCPLVGRVSMDLVVADVTDVPEDEGSVSAQSTHSSEPRRTVA